MIIVISQIAEVPAGCRRLEPASLQSGLSRGDRPFAGEGDGAATDRGRAYDVGDDLTSYRNVRFEMKRREMMKLASLAVMLPMMPGVAKANSENRAPALRYKVFTVTRPGLNRDVPPGKESLMWVANSATLIYGERDAVLVDTLSDGGAVQRLGRRRCCERESAEGNLCHSRTWRSLFRAQDSAGSLSKRAGIGDTGGRRENEAADHAGKIEQPMAQAVPKPNCRRDFHRGPVARQ